MAPIKFEEDIRDKLEKRQLQPSTDAWRSLSDRLDEEPIKRNNKAYWWIGIAASFIGLIMVSSILFIKDSRDIGNRPVLAEEETRELIQEEATVNNMEVVEQTIQEPETVLDVPEIEKKKPETEFTPIHETVVETSNENPQKIEKTLLKEDTIQEITKEITAVASNLKEEKTLEQQKVDEVVALIQKRQEGATGITDAEIDVLLGQARKELATKRIKTASPKVVDAEQLLMQVETDLDRSFRDRVFEALNTGISRVRTAVADRNN